MQHHPHTTTKAMVEVCIKLVKCTMTKCHYTNADIHLALLQFRTMPLGPGLPSPAALLFNNPTRGKMPIIDRTPISIDNDDEYHKALVKRQTKNDKKYDPARNYTLLPIGSTVAVKREGSDRWTHGTTVGKGDYIQSQ